MLNKQLKLFILLLILNTDLFIYSLVNRTEVFSDFPKEMIYIGAMIRLSSLEGDCWLDVKYKILPRQYEDGRGSSGLFMSACIPKYKTQHHKQLNDYLQERSYERDGPFFFLKGTNKEADINLDDMELVSNGTTVSMIMEKIGEDCLMAADIASSSTPHLMEVSGYRDNQKVVKQDCNWNVLTVDGENWKKGQIIQLHHKSTGGILGLTGSLLPEQLRGKEQWKEVAGFSTMDINDQNRNSTLWVVDKIRFREDIEYVDEQTFEDIFGVGTIKQEDSEKLNNTALSIEDLYILHERELELLDKVLLYIPAQELDSVLSKDGYSISIIRNTIVNHPIDNYNLLKRTSRTWRKLHDAFETKEVRDLIVDAEYFLPHWDNCRVFAPLGLLLLQFYHELEPKDLVNGKIIFEGKTYQAASKLRAEDVRLIAKTAREKMRYLNSEILWYAALPELKKFYKKAVEFHDNILLEPIKVFDGSFYTFKDRVGSSHLDFDPEVFKDDLQAQRELFGSTDVLSNIDHMIRNCKGEGNPPAGTDHICENLHFQDSYLKLGPFRLEKHFSSPIVAQIHDFMYSQEMDQVKNDTKGDMRSTPYQVDGVQVEFSSKRTSKIKYISERSNQLIAKISQRMELGLAFNLYKPNYRYTSENYQVMNYGVGGHISLHVDANGLPNIVSIGGGRVTTSMVYLSDVEAGGRTIFPFMNVSIAPEAGSLLYWSLQQTDGYTNNRMLHMGCPVVYGNKWIANKWVNWKEQINRFPCHIQHKMFPHHHHTIQYNNHLHSQKILSL